MAKFIRLLILLMLWGCATSGNGTYSTSKKAEICSEYSWDDVKTLVQPYLNDTLYTSLVMQEQSSEYNPSAAASHVLGMGIPLPDDIRFTLESISGSNC